MRSFLLPKNKIILSLYLLPERKLDLFLTEMRRKKVPPIALKAIVTTQNQAWNSLQLYRELKEEHEKMKSYRK